MKTKLLLLSIFILLKSSIISGQPYKYIYYLDQNLSSVEKEKASFIGKGYIQKDGLCKLDCFNKADNSLIISAHFTDSTLSILHGLFQSFYADTKKENEGDFLNNLENGIWKKWNQDGLLTDSILYENGKALIHGKFDYFPSNELFSFELTDSFNDKYQKIRYNSNGEIKSELIFTGKAGILRKYENSKILRTDSVFDRKFDDIDKVFTKVEIEASFPGGVSALRTYIERNTNLNIPFKNSGGPNSHTVFVKFIVDIDGTVSDIKTENSLTSGMSELVTNLIKKGPKWLPAIQNGHPVKSFHREPITFMYERN